MLWSIAATEQGTQLLVSHTRRLPRSLKKLLKRRQAIEPVIGHMKNDGLLDRNWLKGALGDAIHALLCGAGHNLRIRAARVVRDLRLAGCPGESFSNSGLRTSCSGPTSYALREDIRVIRGVPCLLNDSRDRL